MDNILEDLTIKLTGDASGVVAEWKRAGDESKEILEKMGENLSSEIAIGFLKAEAAIKIFEEGLRVLKEITVDAVKEQLDHIYTQTYLADRLGISTQAMEAFAISAERAAIPQAVLVDALGHMERILAIAQDETTQQARAFRELGLSVEDLRKESPDVVFGEIAEALSKVPDQAAKARLSVELFSRGGLQIIGVLNKGKEGLEESAKAAEDFGLSLTRIEAEKVSEAVESFKELHEVVEGAATQLTVVLAPYLKMAAERIADMARESGGFRAFFEDAMKNAIIIAGHFLDAIHVLELAWVAFKLGILEVEKAGVNAFISIGAWIQRTVMDVKLGSNAIISTFNVIWQEIKLGVVLVQSGFEGMFHYVEEGLAKLLHAASDGISYFDEDTGNALAVFATNMDRAAAKGSKATQEHMAEARAAVLKASDDAGKAWNDVFDPNRDTGENTDPRVLRWKQAVDDAVMSAQEELGQVFEGLRPNDDFQNTLNEMLKEIDDFATEAANAVSDSIAPHVADNSAALAQLREGLNQQSLAENEFYQAQVSAAQVQFAQLQADKVTQDAVLERLNAEHNARVKVMNLDAAKANAALWATGLQGQLTVTNQIFGSLATLMQAKHREMFEVGKVAAIAQATINTYNAATGAYAAMASIPYVGPALGIAAAAAALAAGFAQVDAIQSTSFGGGGGSTSSIPGGGSAVSTTSQNGATGSQGELRGTGQSIILNLGNDDDITTIGAVRKLIKKISQAQGDGALITVG